MNTNWPGTLGITDVFRESPLPVTLILPAGAVAPSVVEVDVYYFDVIQPDVVVPASVDGLIVTWTFTVVQLRAMVGKKAKFTVSFDGNIVAGNTISPTLGFGFPNNQEIVIHIDGVGDTRVVFTENYQEIQALATRTESAADRAYETEQRIKALSIQSRQYRGSWNILTNTPNLAGLTLNNTTDKGAFWKVAYDGAGTTSLTGVSIDAKPGDEFTWDGTGWNYDTFEVTDGSITGPKLAPDVEAAILKTVEVLGARYPVVKDANEVMIASFDAFANWYCKLHDSSLSPEVRAGLMSAYDNEFVYPGARWPLYWDPISKKAPLTTDASGILYGRFDTDKMILPRNSRQWIGKKVVWTGTSQPQGGAFAATAYPIQVGVNLGCEMVNASISGSPIVRRGAAASLSLSSTIAELGPPYDAPSYENIVIGKSYDALVINHDINDCDHIPTYLGTINSVDNTTFYGAYNKIISAYLTDMEDGIVVLVSGPSRYIPRSATIGAWYSQMLAMRDAHAALAEKWGCAHLDLGALAGINDQNLINWFPDGNHPNRQETHDRLAIIATEFFKQIA